MSIEKFLYIINAKLNIDRLLQNIKCKSHLIIHKKVEANSSFPAIKTHTWKIILYKTRQQFEPIIVISRAFNTSRENDKFIEEELLNEAVAALLEYIIKDYNSLINN